MQYNLKNQILSWYSLLIVPFNQNKFLFKWLRKVKLRILKNTNCNPPTTPNKSFQQENFIKLNGSNNEI